MVGIGHYVASKGLRKVRRCLAAWVKNAQVKEDVLREMCSIAGERAKTTLSSWLPEKATQSQRFLAMGFLGFSLLTFWFVVDQNYSLSNDSQLSLFYALLCALGIQIETEYGGKKNA